MNELGHDGVIYDVWLNIGYSTFLTFIGMSIRCTGVNRFASCLGAGQDLMFAHLFCQVCLE